MDHCATKYLLQAKSMRSSQHTTQSIHHVSGNSLSTPSCTSPCFRTTLIINAAPPGKWRDSVKLTALSTAIPETPRTKERPQLLVAPPMHEIHKKGTLKDYLKYSDRTRDATEDEEMQSMQKDEKRRNTETKQNT